MLWAHDCIVRVRIGAVWADSGHGRARDVAGCGFSFKNQKRQTTWETLILLATEAQIRLPRPKVGCRTSEAAPPPRKQISQADATGASRHTIPHSTPYKEVHNAPKSIGARPKAAPRRRRRSWKRYTKPKTYCRTSQSEAVPSKASPKHLSDCRAPYFASSASS